MPFMLVFLIISFFFHCILLRLNCLQFSFYTSVYFIVATFTKSFAVFVTFYLSSFKLLCYFLSLSVYMIKNLWFAHIIYQHVIFLPTNHYIFFVLLRRSTDHRMVQSVSYTHLDVYKRQAVGSALDMRNNFSTNPLRS